MYTSWNNADLADLCEKAENILVEELEMCICCKITIAWEEGVCEGCLDALADACAILWEEKKRVERGLYG